MILPAAASSEKRPQPGPLPASAQLQASARVHLHVLTCMPPTVVAPLLGRQIIASTASAGVPFGH
jgi:hypothetical protein